MFDYLLNRNRIDLDVVYIELMKNMHVTFVFVQSNYFHWDIQEFDRKIFEETDKI